MAPQHTKKRLETNYDKIISNASWCIQKSAKDPKTWGRTRAFASNVSLSKCCCLSSARAAGRQDTYLCACCKVPCDSCRSSYQFSPSSLSWLLSGLNGFQTCLRIGKTYPSRIGSVNFRGFLGGRKCFPASLCIPLGWNLNPFFMQFFKIWIQAREQSKEIHDNLRPSVKTQLTKSQKQGNMFCAFSFPFHKRFISCLFNVIFWGKLWLVNCIKRVNNGTTVDGRNPASPWMVDTLKIMG